jgi:Tfp pilus assembly protein PilV
MEIAHSVSNKVAMRRSAFTLPEVLVTVGFSSVLFLTIYLALAQGVVVVGDSREKLRATQILAERMEAIRVRNWDQTNPLSNSIPATTNVYFYPDASDGNQGVNYQITMTITNAPVTETYAGDVRLFTAKATWTSHGIQHQQQMQTYVSRFGLQNYLYPVTP